MITKICIVHSLLTILYWRRLLIFSIPSRLLPAWYTLHKYMYTVCIDTINEGKNLSWERRVIERTVESMDPSVSIVPGGSGVYVEKFVISLYDALSGMLFPSDANIKLTINLKYACGEESSPHPVYMTIGRNMESLYQIWYVLGCLLLFDLSTIVQSACVHPADFMYE